jgi:hypothetical protein
LKVGLNGHDRGVKVLRHRDGRRPSGLQQTRLVV